MIKLLFINNDSKVTMLNFNTHINSKEQLIFTANNPMNNSQSKQSSFYPRGIPVLP